MIPSCLKFGSSKKWSEEQIQWLKENYPDTEDYDLALALNCAIVHVIEAAKKNHWYKSEEFCLWLAGAQQDPTCPKGFHWETDKEREEREKKEIALDQQQAKAIARTFSFCSEQEKEHLAGVLTQVIKWGRETS